MDRVLADWAGQRPDLDFTPVGVVTRLSLIRSYLHAELAGAEVISSTGLAVQLENLPGRQTTRAACCAATRP